MIYVWAMEQKRRKFEKQDVFVPWNPNPPISCDFVRDHPTPRRRAAAQSVSDVKGNSDKQRKVKSTSSMVDEEDLGCSSQQRTQKLWFFSRSLDSVFDSLTISRSSSRELSTLSTRVGQENAGSKAIQPGRGRGLMKQVSSLFSSSSSRNSLEEDVFDSLTDLLREQIRVSATTATPEQERVSPALTEECGSVALPDLVSYMKEPTNQPREGEQDASPLVEEHQKCTLIPKEKEEEIPASSCLRYYHVFREGELAELIQNYVEELHVLHSYFDHANWCVVAEKVQVWKI